ncbi:MAG: helicase-related protein, partial [Hyphomicrobiales bacterium]|nr:helicase-related protein [Hyphomicrobiales bacterium]
RGHSETLLLGAATMQETVRELLPGANIVSRPRLSKLSYAGQKKVSRLPRRTAIVAFSASDVYAIAELVRRQRGGAAVVLGALSPKTRNAQVDLYQNGEVDFLVATDAIGMGLNLDVDHVAFAGISKFDGKQTRDLTPAEIGQIAGRAGRHMNDGTFGVTARVEPFGPELVNALEAHEFEPVKVLSWRSRDLDFASLARLKESLQVSPDEPRLARARMADDVAALEALSREAEIARAASAPAAIRQLWDVCQVPDYRKISAAAHAELLADIYSHLMSDAGTIPEDWFASHVAFADRTDGDIDTLANRIAHIRTWTFVSHRSEWLDDPEHWQQRTREIEDKLSDALHERLTLRFVDRRTSVLMKRLRDKDELFAEISSDGAVEVERHFVGRLHGFHFTPDTTSADIHGKAARHAAARVLSEELTKRAERLVSADAGAFTLALSGRIEWEGEAVAKLERGETALAPGLTLLADDHLKAADAERVTAKLKEWLSAHIGERLAPLVELSTAEDITGLARGMAFRLVETLGILKRETVAEEIRALDQEARGQLRKHGVRFGAFNIYVPVLLKPAASDLIALLWTLHEGGANATVPVTLPKLPRQGLTSAPTDAAIPEALYRMAGFHMCGKRVVRIDMLERLADMIRPLVAWRPTAEKTEPPLGATGKGGFRVQPDMMSIVGCSGEDFAAVLQALGFNCERKPLADARHASKREEKVVPDATDAPAPAGEKLQKQEQEQEFDEIWRPRRKQKAQQRKPGRAGAAAKNKGRKSRPHTAPPRGKGRPAATAKRGPKKAKEPDPDSPFAALKDLKRDLESSVKEQA